MKYGDPWKQGEMEIIDKENVVQKRSREKPEKGHLDGSVDFKCLTLNFSSGHDLIVLWVQASHWALP